MDFYIERPNTFERDLAANQAHKWEKPYFSNVWIF